STLLALTQGRYDWRGWEPPPPWAREVVVDPLACLVDALEQEQHAPRRAKVIAWLGHNPVRLSVDWPDLQTRTTLGAVDRRAAGLLAIPRRMPDFMQASQLPQARAEAVLVALLLAGGAEPDPGGERLDEREAIARLESVEVEAAPQAEAQPEEEEELELDLERAASTTAPKPRTAEAASGADEASAKQLRKRMLARGMRNLGALPTRAEFEGAVAVTPKVTEVAPKAPTAPVKEDKRLAEEVRSRLEAAPGQTAYVRLGVEAAATTEMIRNAYLDAAKRFHPDKAVGLASLHEELAMLFALLKEAYEAIATPDARARYDASLKARGGGSRKEEAAIAVKMGEVLLKKRDYEGALAK